MQGDAGAMWRNAGTMWRAARAMQKDAGAMWGMLDESKEILEQ